MIKSALYIFRLSSFLILLLRTLFNPPVVFSTELPITCESVLHQEIKTYLLRVLYISISQKQRKTWERPLENMWLCSIALIRWTSEDLAGFTKVHSLYLTLTIEWVSIECCEEKTKTICFFSWPAKLARTNELNI